MNSGTASLIVLIVSFFTLAIFIFRKIPALNNLPQASQKSAAVGLTSRAKSAVSKIPGLKSFSFEIFLQKILSKVRVITLKTDHKTFAWLQKLREKNHKRLENKNYWEELKNSKDDLKK